MEADPIRRRRGGMVALLVLVALAVAACSSNGAESTTTSTIQTTIVVEGTTTTTLATSTTTTLSVDKASVVQEYVDRRSDGRIVESLELATTQVREEYLERQKGLAAWNFRSEQAGPCEEVLEGYFACPMLEYTDFHTIAGISPWTNNMAVRINDEGIITNAVNNVIEWTTVSRFNRDFSQWLTSAHPEEAAKMNGTLMTVPLTEEYALIAIQFVEEFVASLDEG